MKIGFDLDGVIIDSYEVIRQGLLDVYNINFPMNEHLQFEFNIPGVKGIEIVNTISRIVADKVDECKPVNGSIEALYRIYNITNEPLNFITARTNEINNETNEFLKKYLDIPYNLIMTDGGFKKDIIKKMGITHYVDDRFKEIEICSSVLKLGFIFDYPWNHGRKFNRSNIVRIKSLEEIIPFIRW